MHRRISPHDQDIVHVQPQHAHIGVDAEASKGADFEDSKTTCRSGDDIALHLLHVSARIILPAELVQAGQRSE